MSYEPENPTSDIGTDAQAWLARELEAISSEYILVRSEMFQVGGGGIALETPTTGVGPLTTTPTKIPGSAYDTEISENPVGMEQDLANGRIRITTDGLWYVTMNCTGEIVPVTSNESNRINVSVYNETDGVLGDQPAIFTVPRYGDAFQCFQGALFRINESDINKWFSLYIWMENTTPAITITDLLSLELSVFRAARG